MRVQALSLLVGIVGFGIAVPAALGAAPRFIVVAGPGLGEPVILDNWDENLRLLVATLDEGKNVDAESLAHRPYLDVALLWGSWSKADIERLGAEEIAARGTGGDYDDRFYPAVDSKKAVVAIYLADRPGPREAGSTVLAILARHGIPTALSDDGSGGSWWPWITGGVVAGAVLLVTVALIALRRPSRPSPA